MTTAFLIVVLHFVRAVAAVGLAAAVLAVAIHGIQLLADLRHRPPARHRSVPRHSLGRS